MIEYTRRPVGGVVPRGGVGLVGRQPRLHPHAQPPAQPQSTEQSEQLASTPPLHLHAAAPPALTPAAPVPVPASPEPEAKTIIVTSAETSAKTPTSELSETKANRIAVRLVNDVAMPATPAKAKAKVVPKSAPAPKILPTHHLKPSPEVDESLLQQASSNLYKPSPARQKQIDKVVTVGEHLAELRKRLAYSLIALLIGTAIGYNLREQVISILVKPLGKQLYYTNPTGGLDFLLKICMFIGFIVALPVIVYNLIQFVAPAVKNRLAERGAKILFYSVILAAAGMTFAYVVCLPAALKFLGEFTSGKIESLITASEYFNFVMLYLGGFAALFQMPLIFVFVNKINRLNAKKLMSKQRVVILVGFVVAAILTPTPDPLNQTLMALPIIVLYQLSVSAVWLANRRRPAARTSRADVVLEY